jgi:hypothetical protein
MNKASTPRHKPVLSKAVTIVKMPEHALSIRHIFDDWPVGDLAAISRAKRDYDEGLVELCTGRVGEHFVLYCIPRKQKAEPRRWFSYSGVY